MVGNNEFQPLLAFKRTLVRLAAKVRFEPRLPIFCSAVNVGYAEIGTSPKVVENRTVRHVVSTARCHQMRQLIMQGL